MSLRTSSLFVLHCSHKWSASLSKSSRPKTSLPCMLAMYLNSGRTWHAIIIIIINLQVIKKFKFDDGRETYEVDGIRDFRRIQWRTKVRPRRKVRRGYILSLCLDTWNVFHAILWAIPRSNDVWMWNLTCPCKSELRRWWKLISFVISNTFSSNFNSCKKIIKRKYDSIFNFFFLRARARGFVLLPPLPLPLPSPVRKQ